MQSKIIFLGIISALFLCSCGHNFVQYGDGVGIDLGIRPQNGIFSVTLRYGKIMTAAVRDNTEIDYDNKKFNIKVGKQINGAAVDLEKAKKQKTKE
jgi:hypothetical protein